MNRFQSFTTRTLSLRLQYAIIVCLLALGQLSCSAKRPPADFNGNFTTEIDSRTTFDKLKGRPLSDKYSGDESVKLVYDVKSDKLYYLASVKFIYHYEFCAAILGYHNGLEYFNRTNYGPGDQRQYILATLNYFTASHIYALEFVGTDISTSAEIERLYKAVKETAFFGDSLKVLINTTNLLNQLSANTLHVETVFPDAVFGGQEYQAVNEGIVYGYLKRISKPDKAGDSIQEHDIILIRENPVDIPYCAGIITTQFQTPLSHINILSHNRGSLCFAHVNAWNDETLKQFNGKLVKLVVQHNNYSISEASVEEAAKFWKDKADKKPVKLKSDLNVRTLPDLSQLDARSYLSVGSKAANLAELQKLQRQDPDLFKTPEGAFAIPFYFFDQHVHQSSVNALIETLLADTATQHNTKLLADALKKIRKAIKDAPLNKDLLHAVELKIQKAEYGNAYRFRSSTNAEDIVGFNGAGLYDSKTGILGDTAKSIEDAIKEVWASAYTYRAFSERSFFNIDERTVNMAILVHRSFPAELSNGVAITTNLYRRDFPGFVVNVQPGEISVVAPGDSIICDQFICVDAAELNRPSDKVMAEYITFSNQNGGKPVLTDAEITELYNALLAIKKHFFDRSHTGENFSDFAMDVEFKFDGNDHQLYIKQARPFN